MKNILTFFAASLFLATPAFAVDATGNAQVELVKPLSITQDIGLEFGDVMSGGDMVYQAAAQFSLSGMSWSAYTLTLDPEVTLSDGANSMTATLVRAPNIGWLDADGEGLEIVGGDLSVPQSQAAGAYTGQYNVTVEYQ